MLIAFNEPEISFGRGQERSTIDPVQGLITYHPLDYNNTTRTIKNEIKLAIIGKREDRDAIMIKIGQLNQTHKATRIYREYPGFENVYCIKISVDADLCQYFDSGDVDNIITSPEPLNGIVDLYSTKIDLLDEKRIPYTLLLLCLPQEFESFFFAENQDLRAMLKAKCIGKNKYSQFLTYLYATPPDMCDFLWNLSLGIYVSGGGVPWELTRHYSGISFIGITFGIKRGRDRQDILVGIAEIFNEYGESVSIRAINDSFTSDKGLHLSRDKMRSLMTNIIKDYIERTGMSPTNLVIHKTSDYLNDEIEGILDCIDETTKVDLIYLKANTTLQLYPEKGEQKAGFPPCRGTFWKITDRTGLLYTTGYIDRFGTFPGQGTPRPKEIIKSYGEANIENIAEQILALTKMNWNTARYMVSEPVTMEYARKIISITKVGDLDPTIRDFRFYF